MAISRFRLRTLVAAFALALIPLLLAPAASQAAEKKRAITETDFFQFVWVTDPQISPDGSRVVFVRVTIDKKKQGYDTALWIVDADGKTPARPFTAGPHDQAPRWSPDGKTLAFVRITEDKDDPMAGGAQIYLLSTSGGEATALTELAGGAGVPVWSPDGKRIAFVAGANEKDLAKWKAAQAKKDDVKKDGAEKKEEEHESDAVVITRALFRQDGGGYADFTRPGHLWTVDVPADGAARTPAQQITSGAFDEDNPRWSPDGKLLYFASFPEKEPYYKTQESKLWSISSTGAGGMKGMTLVHDRFGGIGDFAVSPDGKRLVYEASENGDKERSYDENGLEYIEIQGDKVHALTLTLDGDVGGGVAGDQHAPRGGRSTPLVFSRDGRRVIALLGSKGRANLTSFGLDEQKAEALTSGDQEVFSYTATPNADRFALAISDADTIGDLFALDAATGKLTPLYRPNEELFAQLKMAPLEELTYDSFDGRKIQGFVQLPPDFDRTKKYPLIVNIHGGPHAAYGYAFFHEIQWMAAKGYVVLYTNPRGSSSFGQEFGNSNQYDFPGADAKDILAGVDVLVKRGYIDPKRLGVTGGSGGGILTNWIVTQDQRFAAAVSQRSISDWRAFWGTTDFTLFTKMWFRGAPWEDPEDYAKRSPLTYVTQIVTPLLFIEGELDYRTPPAAGGEPMFRALKYLKKPTAMVRYPGEGHELSRSGQPWHRVERLQHILGWFDKYLKGEKVEAFADMDPASN